MGLEVTYKGAQIAQLTSDGILTLGTAGKYCEADIGITYSGGDAVAYIGATWPVGSACTCSNGTTTLEADDTGGVYIFRIPTAGSWTVNCTNGSATASKSVTVVAGHVYAVELAYVQLEPFATASDENFVEIIRAAHNGIINLHTDAGWSVGDTRTINVSAFTGGGGSAYDAAAMKIAISSFDDYENCGCVMQFDFTQVNGSGQRINASSNNAGGYGNSEMYQTSLPAFVNALPDYLRGLLIEFNCKASAGSGSSAIETVTGNKLALRSEVEVFGTTSYSYTGEGSLIPYYATSANRLKRHVSNNVVIEWWLRSPYKGGSKSFCCVDRSGGINGSYANNGYWMSPFGCI